MIDLNATGEGQAMQNLLKRDLVCSPSLYQLYSLSSICSWTITPCYVCLPSMILIDILIAVTFLNKVEILKEAIDTE